MKHKIIIVLMILITLLFSACTQTTPPTPIPPEMDESQYDVILEDYVLEIFFNDTSLVYSALEIRNMEPETLTFRSITSSGEELNTVITGVSLNTLLAPSGIRQDLFDEIRLLALDGYSMVVPNEIVNTKDIYVIWEENNEPLIEQFFPLRIAIADERSMYWVGQLIEIELISGSAMVPSNNLTQTTISKLVFVENAISTLDGKTVDFEGADDEVIAARDFIDSFNNSPHNGYIAINAIDGFSKSELSTIFESGYLKYTGIYAPLFYGPDLPQGMHVKYILWLLYGDTLYVTESLVFEKFAENIVEILEMDSVPFALIREMTGFPTANNYLLTATDGYSKEIDAETMDKAALYINDDLEFGISFEGLEKRAIVKNILSIEVIND